MTNNLTVIRAFAFVVQEGYNMQLSDGTYNESLLVAMDNVVAEASTRGLKLIMALANNWNYNSNMSDTKCAALPCHAHTAQHGRLAWCVNLVVSWLPTCSQLNMAVLLQDVVC